jgi:hypothetical protein
MMDALLSSETLVLIRATRLHIPEDDIHYETFLRIEKSNYSLQLYRKTDETVAERSFEKSVYFALTTRRRFPEENSRHVCNIGFISNRPFLSNKLIPSSAISGRHFALLKNTPSQSYLAWN